MELRLEDVAGRLYERLETGKIHFLDTGCFGPMIYDVQTESHPENPGMIQLSQEELKEGLKMACLKGEEVTINPGPDSYRNNFALQIEKNVRHENVRISKGVLREIDKGSRYFQNCALSKCGDTLLSCIIGDSGEQLKRLFQTTADSLVIVGDSYRESHSGEVRHPPLRNRFRSATLANWDTGEGGMVDPYLVAEAAYFSSTMAEPVSIVTKDSDIGEIVRESRELFSDIVEDHASLAPVTVEVVRIPSYVQCGSEFDLRTRNYSLNEKAA